MKKNLSMWGVCFAFLWLGSGLAGGQGTNVWGTNSGVDQTPYCSPTGADYWTYSNTGAYNGLYIKGDASYNWNRWHTTGGTTTNIFV